MDQNASAADASAIDYTELTAEVVSAYVANNPVPPTELARLIATTHAALAALAGLGDTAGPAAPPSVKTTPAQIRKSITPEALISFEDGKRYKTLKRHLTGLGLTPDAYRAKWGLPQDYPLVATSYSETRSALARSAGLGLQRRKSAPETARADEAVAAKPKRAGRPRKAETPAEA
ncbi:MucR family transcriptional regulator [Methylobacterium sp. 190mf]|uniref:MucR family transcriptional regulator n=1 Tax=Methylobacterium sp. 190mf TaxID=1761798 RepID=UPI002453721D|nr:MucR family transcriptional regulator [Methylobacterium sp. 190mf]